MTPKEEAEGLVWEYYNTLEHTISDEYSKKDWEIAKQCALIAVSRILNMYICSGCDDCCISTKHLQEVKTEIEKL